MVLLEVEQKFIFNPLLHRAFQLNKGKPPFRSLQYHGIQSFTDTYFDRGDLFARNGIWIRKRDDEWEMKKRQMGSYTRTAFEEIHDRARIHELVCQFLPGSVDAEKNYGLDVSCHFTTTRESYLADERFGVVLDKTDFGHAVGEVELEHEDATQAHAEIDRFLGRYSWFFDKRKPKGKLTAYFEKFGQK